MSVVSAKQKALEVVERLPPDSTLEDALEHLYFLYEAERGLAEADVGDPVQENAPPGESTSSGIARLA